MIKKIGIILMYFLALAVGIYSIKYWNFEKTGILLSKPENLLSDLFYQFSFYGHVFFGPLALISGPFQFSAKLRKKNIIAHRNLGYVYVIACLLSGIAGLSAAQNATGGIWNEWGFSLLAVSWLTATIYAWISIRNKKMDKHQDWMIRSFALTFSAVTLRLQLGIFQGVFDLSFWESYSIVAWSCWIPNLLFAEWLIRK